MIVTEFLWEKQEALNRLNCHLGEVNYSNIELMIRHGRTMKKWNLNYDFWE